MKPLERLAELMASHAALDRILQETVELATATIQGATDASITVVRGDQGEGFAFSSQTAIDVDERQYGLDQGPCLDASRGHEVFVIDNMRAETKWPDYRPYAAEAGVLSSISVPPLPVQEEILGALNVYGRAAGAFEERSVDQAKRFADYAAVAIANAQLYASTAEAAEHMKRAMESRAVIEQAKGILMAQRRCGASEAFDVLVAASQRENMKLRIVAERIVEGISR
ncbi:MAG: ANTAR domain-containing protein [Actinomycetota bacterium]